jgi:DNA invertase Pin-like site-specific DNA recombinase
VAEYFDVGVSRSHPWKRRPESLALLDALRRPDRGFEAVVIGEPARAFHGAQFQNTFPLFVHFGVQLWVPDVGGYVDPAADGAEMMMAIYGTMSTQERRRIKMRVRSAMEGQAQHEGRFLVGGRRTVTPSVMPASTPTHPRPLTANDFAGSRSTLSPPR